MARVILAAASAVVILAVTYAATTLEKHLPERQPVPLPAKAVQEGYSLELTLTAQAAPDSFCDYSLLVRVSGRHVLRRAEAVAGPTIQLKLPDLEEGEQEIYVEVVASDQEMLQPRAARLRVVQGEREVASTLLWADPGIPLQGRMLLRVPLPQEHAHQH